jgi:hypothetical protein
MPQKKAKDHGYHDLSQNVQKILILNTPILFGAHFIGGFGMEELVAPESPVALLALPTNARILCLDSL